MGVFKQEVGSAWAKISRGPIPTAGKTKRAHEHAQAYTDRKRVLDPLNINGFLFTRKTSHEVRGEQFEIIFFFPKQEIKSLKTKLNKNLQTAWRKEEKHVPAHNPRERI